MNPVNWDPFKDVSSLQDRINRMFEDYFPQRAELDPASMDYDWQPAADIYETEAGLTIEAELPGVDKNDVSVELKRNILTLRGRRKPEGDVEARRYLRKERSFGTFQRVFALKVAADPEKIKARFKDGVLNIDIPRMETEPPKSIKVDVT